MPLCLERHVYFSAISRDMFSVLCVIYSFDFNTLFPFPVVGHEPGFCMMCTMQNHIIQAFANTGNVIKPIVVLNELKSTVCCFAGHLHATALLVINI